MHSPSPTPPRAAHLFREVRSLSSPGRGPAGSLRACSLALLVAAAILLSGCSSDQPEQPERPPHLVLLTIDTLRADHMSLHGYPRPTTPRLEQFAQGAVTFDRAIVQWPKTGTSFASMFIGRYPQSTGLTHRASLEIPPAFGTLPKALHEAGYRSVAVVSNPVLSRDLGWDRGFDEYLHSWGEDMSDELMVFREQLSAASVNRVAFAALDELLAEPGDEPLFLWFHYSDPHAPYTIPEGTENPYVGDDLYEAAGPTPAPEALGAGRHVPGLVEERQYVANYDANIAIVDDHIGRMLDRLEQEGILQDAVTVITSDHGESLGEHGLFYEHGPLPYNTTSHVPLVIGLPGGEGAGGTRVAEPVELIDLAPTLVDLLPALRGLESGFEPVRVAPAAPRESDADDVAEVAARDEGRLGADEEEGAESGADSPESEAATLAALGPFDQTFEGRSLAPFLRGDAPPDPAEIRPAYSEAGQAGRRRYRSLQEDQFKLVFREPGRERRPEPRDFELYDLLQDPLETTNLLEQQPSELRRLRRLILEFAARSQPSLTEQRRPRSDKERRALEKLGYL